MDILQHEMRPFNKHKAEIHFRLFFKIVRVVCGIRAIKHSRTKPSISASLSSYITPPRYFPTAACPRGFRSYFNRYHIIALYRTRITEGCNVQMSAVAKWVYCLP